HATPLERQRYAEGARSTGGLRRLRNLRAQRRLPVGMPARVVVGVNEASRELGVGLLEDISPQGARVLLDHPVAAGSVLKVQIPGSVDGTGPADLAGSRVSGYEASGRVVFVRALETSVGMRFVVGFTTGSDVSRAPGAGQQLY